MNYFVRSNLKNFFNISIERVDIGKRKFGINLMIRSCFKDQSKALFFKLRIPMPDDLIDWKSETKRGSFDYKAGTNELEWTVVEFKGGDLYELNLVCEVPTIESSRLIRE